MSELKSVLLVDDDPHTCNIFRMVMEHYHLQLEVTSDAESALSFLKSNAPDVIVLDIFLPGIDGYQAFNQIRQTALAPTSCIVATTAYYTKETERDVLERGFNGYLPKPLDSQALVGYLQRIVANN